MLRETWKDPAKRRDAGLVSDPGKHTRVEDLARALSTPTSRGLKLYSPLLLRASSYPEKPFKGF